MKKFMFVTLSALFVFCAVSVYAQDGRPVTTKGGESSPNATTMDANLKLTWLARPSQMNLADGINNESTVGWIGHALIGWNFAFADNTSSRIELEMLDYPGAAQHANYLGVGNNASQGVAVNEAWINLAQLFSPSLGFKIGLQDYEKKLRDEDNGGFYMGLGRGGVSGGATGSDTVGIVATVAGADDKWTLDIAYLTVDEVAAGDANDTTGTGGFFRYIFGEGQHLDADLALYHADGGASIIDIGAGLLWSNVGDMEGLDPYAEVHIQSGEVATDVDAGGMAYRLGGRYTFAQTQGNPFIDVSWWSITGDDATTADEDEEYVSLESNNEFLILESVEYGLNVRSNYTAIRVSGGMTTNLNVTGASNASDNLDLVARLGSFKLEEDNGAADDSIGTEIDVEATWHLNSAVDVFAAVAFLSGSDVLEAATAGDPDVMDDSTMMFLFGTEVGF